MATSSEQTSLSDEPASGPRSASGTPLASYYSKRTIGAGFLQLMEQRLASALRGLDARVERLTVRYEDLNGPKGGVDTSCRIQLKLSAEPMVVVEGRAQDEARAFRVTLPRLIAAVDRQLNRRAERSRTSLRSLFG
jgi:hypothetical protein